MLNKKEFVEFVTRILQIMYSIKGMRDLKITPCEKVNCVKTSVSFLPKENSNTSPIVCIEDFYESYKRGNSMDQIIVKILHILCSTNNVPFLTTTATNMSSWEEVKDRVIMTLVNTEASKQLLEKYVSIPYMDLSIYFKINVSTNKDENSYTIPITNAIFDNWHITTDELYASACKSSRKITPAKVEPLKNILLEIVPGMDIPEDDNNMYIITNKQKLCGASVIVYSDVLKELSEKLENNFFLLPCSIHEWLCIQDKGEILPHKLQEMVYDVNMSQVSPEERLSNNVYYYDRKDNKVIRRTNSKKALVEEDVYVESDSKLKNIGKVS